MSSARIIAPILLITLICCCVAPAATEPIEIHEAVVIGRVSGGGRAAVPTDAVWYQIASNTFQWPQADQTLALSNGRSGKWQKIHADKDGWFAGQALGGGYVACSVDLPEGAVMLVQAEGDTTAWVNGQTHTGDPYSYGYLSFPARLEKGENHLLVACGRGRLRVKLLPVRGALMLDTRDATLPDVLTSDQGELLGGIVVINTTDRASAEGAISARVDGEKDAAVTPIPSIPPMSMRKVPVTIRVPQSVSGEKLKVALQLMPSGQENSGDVGTIELRVRQPNQVHKRTFISAIDNSVQYYAVNPAQRPSKDNLLILTLHGAAVEALGQASAYASKDDATLVAPTNRRPYGFDWEDMGRLDAIEVLDIAKRTIPHDPHRVILTGHSMGGHGTWQIGLTFPGLFAAIGPSAGWSSFFSYGGGQRFRNASAVEQMIQRAVSPSDTMALLRNSLMEDVYILHGDADDNVPVREARMMRDALKFNPRVIYHEEKGAGHWWGSKCVDWPPMFEMFEKARLPDDSQVREIEFVTADPAVSGKCHWLTIEEQTQALKTSKVKLAVKGNEISGETDNVAGLTIDLSAMQTRVAKVLIDGQSLDVPQNVTGHSFALLRRQDKWSAATELPQGQKSAARGGGFKQVFANHVEFVYGTHGSEEETALELDEARLLAETLYYRGNGAVDILSDTEFQKRAADDRNVVLFGNSLANAAWQSLLNGCPCDVREGSIQIGNRDFVGKDLGALLLYPRHGSNKALVGAIAATGPAGGRLTERLPILVSGVGYPDWMVIQSDALRTGDRGVLATGFFANDWSFDPSQSAFAEPPETRPAQ